jgi:hypothetical protein
MAPFTCQVFNHSLVGVPGLRVTLECSIHDSSIYGFENHTDINGRVEMWSPLTLTGGFQQLQVVDTADYPRIRAIFHTGPYFGNRANPYYIIQTDLNLVQDIAYILYLTICPDGWYYQIKHSSSPVFNISPGDNAMDGVSRVRSKSDSWSYESPTPLLPPPPRSGLFLRGLLPQKRKDRCNHEDGPARKRQFS